MDIVDVWHYLNDDVKKAIRAVYLDQNRLDTRTLLGSLSRVSGENPGSCLLRDHFDESDVPLEFPSEIPDDPDSLPEAIKLSPAVEETLNFFRLHRMRSVSVAQVAKRLLQIGTGDTIRLLEERNVLQELVESLENIK